MSVVYFIGCAGRIKIGVTKNLKSRVGALQTSAPDTLSVLATVPGATKLERELHSKLQPHRTSGEWFIDCDDVRAAMLDAVIKHDGTLDPEVRAQPKQIPDQIDVPEPEKPTAPAGEWDTVLEANRVAIARFGEMIDSPVLQDMRRARALEHKLGVERGSIVKKIYQCADPAGLHIKTLKRLDQLLAENSAVGDRITLAIVKEDFSSNEGLIRASEVLVERANEAFAVLKAVHRPIVNQSAASR